MFPRANSATKLVATVLASAAAMALCASCGGESFKPTPELTVMGAIHLVRSLPAGGPYQAGVVVAVDGQPITNASVRIDDSPLMYNADPTDPDQAGYTGLIPLQEGQIAELRVSCAAGERTLQTVVPGFAHIASPAPGSTYQDDQDVEVTWTPAAHAVLCAVACGGASAAKPGTWILLGSTTTQTVPASFTTPPGSRINVIGLSGQGDLPSEDLRTWVGKNGFWATSEESVDIQVVG